MFNAWNDARCGYLLSGASCRFERSAEVRWCLRCVLEVSVGHLGCLEQILERIGGVLEASRAPFGSIFS